MEPSVGVELSQHLRIDYDEMAFGLITRVGDAFH